MSVLNRASQRRIAIVGFGVLAISLFGSVAPAAAIGPSRTTLTTSTPSIAANAVAKLKAVVKPVSGTLLPTGNVTFREGSATAPGIGAPVPLALVNSVQTAKLELSGLSIGSHIFYATYNGSADFTASTSLSVTVVVTAVPKAPTTTTLSTSTPTVAATGVAKLKAVVKPVSGTVLPTGNVTFREGSLTAPGIGAPVALALVGTVETAKLELTGLSVGSHTFYATYNGSSNFTASNSSSVTVLVTAVTSTPTTTTLTTSTPTSVTPGTDVKFKAVVKQVSGTAKPTGSVTFSDNGVAITPAVPLALVGTVMTAKITLSGLAVGTHTIGASYAGATGFGASTASPAITVTIGKVGSTTTASITSLTTADKYTLVGVVAATPPATGVPTGSVTFTLTNVDTGVSDPAQPGVLGSTGRATFPGVQIAPGHYTLRVNYLGDDKFNASVGTTTTLTLPVPVP